MSKVICVKLNDNEDDYNHDIVLGHFRAKFPDLEILQGDPLQHSVEVAEGMDCTPEEERAKQIVVASLRRKAEKYGPATAFRILNRTETPILGSVRKRDMTIIIKSESNSETINELIEIVNRRGTIVKVL